MVTKNKKKFKDTALGVFLKNKAPKLLHQVGDFLPDKGVLGIVKHVIESRPDIKQEFDSMSATDKAAFEKLQQDFELEVMKIEQHDRENARELQMIYARSGRIDWMFVAVGSVILLSYIMLVIAIVWFPKHINANPLFQQLMGMVLSLTGILAAFYYGTTKTSKEKTKILEQKAEQL
jgi:hypothetical protein